MKSVRFVCLFVILGSAMLAAQSNIVALIDQPATSKLSSSLSNPDPKTQAKILENYGKLPLSLAAATRSSSLVMKRSSRCAGVRMMARNRSPILSCNQRSCQRPTLCCG